MLENAQAGGADNSSATVGANTTDLGDTKHPLSAKDAPIGLSAALDRHTALVNPALNRPIFTDDQVKFLLDILNNKHPKINDQFIIR